MAANIKPKAFSGGAALSTPDSDGEDLEGMLRAAVDDLAALRAAFVALTAKMDTDFTGQNGAVTSSELDVNYASTLDPVANTLTAS